MKYKTITTEEIIFGEESELIQHINENFVGDEFDCKVCFEKQM